MNCEVCGRSIVGKSYRALIEGAPLIVCGSCVKHGTVSRMPRSPSPVKRLSTRIKVRTGTRMRGQPSRRRQITEPLELIDNYNKRIRQAREQMNLSHEDLGRRIGEKVSVLRKIETGKMRPEHKLAEKLEHSLRIKLLLPSDEPKPPVKGSSRLPELTIGEVVRLKRSEKEDAEEREQS